MRKLLLFISLFFSTFIFAEGGWDVTFHPGNKVGLPDRYACVYTDMDSTYTIMFRSDIRPIKITATYCMFDHDSIGYTNILIKLYARDGLFIEKYQAEGKVLENTIVTTDWKLMDWMLKGNYVKIYVMCEGTEVELKPDRLNIYAHTKYMVD